ncbi:MAG TPA: AraC family transcriptional regulator [Verrucomicrobiae bacterium]|nr:AraC family transcriptional regulator [Verrucomicrobiae bacterium]
MKTPSNRPATLIPWSRSSNQRGYERETFEDEMQLLPELEIFGWLRFHSSLPGGLKPDRHPGAFEIHYMVRGHLHWWVENKQYEFSTGRVFIIRPGELHSGEGSSLQPCEHYWLRVKFPEKGALGSLPEAETACLRDAYERLTSRTFNASREVNEFFLRLLEEHRHRHAPHVIPMARSMLHALLIAIIRDHDHHCQMANHKPLITWRVRRTLDWIENHLYHDQVRFDGVAKNVGLSPAGLRARFKAETGYTFHEYLLHRRIEEAQLRLVEGKDDIITIAHDLGFSSSQYFATAFRRQTGETPSRYRKRHSKF